MQSESPCRLRLVQWPHYPRLAHYGPRAQTARGRFFVGEPVAMHRPAKLPFDGMAFPLILANGLRAIFADLASTPLPERLASLMR
jgi:hypothetical protein